jgi:hypothetical protein
MTDDRTPEQLAMWQAALTFMTEIWGVKYGFGHDRAEYAEDGSMSVTTSKHNLDGTDKVYTFTIKVEESQNEHDSFWGPGGYIDRENIPERTIARIDGHHYVIEPDTDGGFQGMGGRKFTIDFFDGRSVVTHNLWSQGIIPLKWQERHPDNAQFRSAEKVATSDGGHAWNADSDKELAVSQEAWQDLLADSAKKLDLPDAQVATKQFQLSFADLAESSKTEQAADTGVFDTEYMFQSEFEEGEYDPTYVPCWCEGGSSWCGC